MKDVSSTCISSISIVMPAYNDGATIASMIVAAVLAVRQITDDYEIIVTNDGSQDHTGRILDGMACYCPELKVFHHPANRGYGAALRTGFAAARKEWIFYTDGDAQYDPLELLNLAGKVDGNVDVVNGYKLQRGDQVYRRVIGRLYHTFVKFLFGFRLKDVDCDFRLFRRKLLDRVKLTSESGTICLEMVKKFQDAGFRFIEVPVHHYPRPYGVSQFFRPKHLYSTFRYLIYLWWSLVVQKRARALRSIFSKSHPKGQSGFSRSGRLLG